MPSISTLMFLAVVALSTLPGDAVPIPLPQTNNQISDAYSGAGGKASGGSVIGSTGTEGTGIPLLNILSNNAGDGGNATSGNVTTGAGTVKTTGGGGGGSVPTNNSIGNSYGGGGGDANGGDVNGGNTLINILSQNAGSGGIANSGAAGNSGTSSVAVEGSANKKFGKKIRMRWDAAHQEQMD